MNDVQKTLVNLIDETLVEIEELKKSDRFSASEVSIGDSKSGIEGKDKNGKLDKEEDKKDEEDEKKEEEDDMDKAEGKNREADPNGGHHQVAKGEMMAGDSKEGSSTGSAEGKNREADPMSKMDDRMCKMESMMEKMEAHMKKYEDMDKKEDKEEDEKKEEKKDEDKEDMKKSLEASESLIKSTSNRIDSLEKSLENISSMIQELADTPVPSKSVSYRNVQPLKKSEETQQVLSKSEVANKLLELKKSGTSVDSKDITSAELANPAELVKIATKYNIK